METIGRYALETTTSLTQEAAIARATALLAEEGFGVVTEIDLQATLRDKIGVEIAPYRILGACNPGFAHRAVAAEPHVGVLLPCNVVVWDAGDHRVVTAMEPRLMHGLTDAPGVRELADEVSGRLRRVLERIG